MQPNSASAAHDKIQFWKFKKEFQAEFTWSSALLRHYRFKSIFKTSLKVQGRSISATEPAQSLIEVQEP